MSYDDYYDDEEQRGGAGRLLGLAAVLLGAAVLAWFFVIPRFQDDSVASTQSPAPVTTTAEPTSPASSPTDATDTAATDATDATDATEATDETDNSDETGATVEDASSATTTAAITSTTSGEPTSTDPIPAAGAATYPTLPDGSPVPVLAVFDTATVTLSGVVPSAEAAARLDGLAIANSKFPEAEVVSTLTFDPTIPASVGIRVVEMNSVRFPESTADLLPEHRAEIDRAAGILALFPNVSVLVIGHADQRGSAESNFAISEERARAVASYLVSTGIDPGRVSSRAVGELDLLALENDAQSFELNRRTEFVFYGLLTEPE